MKKNSVGVVICNWNKKDYVVNCIKSVKKSEFKDIDIIVVDNASDDGSSELIKKNHPDVTLIQNHENLGGAGGFNTGLRYCIENYNYDYICCLDNDVVIAPDAISELVRGMEKDKSLAFAGSKIMVMDEPGRIQELGAFIDWRKNRIRLNKAGRLDNRPPEVKDTFVNYVPACSLIARVSALKEIGIMDQTYFIYFDDIDWATRAILSGYKIKAIASSKVWHKRGGTTKTSNIPAYYWCRNEGFFFNRYTPESRREKSMRDWMQTYFRAIAACNIYGKKETAEVFKKALLDLTENRRGKVDLSAYPTVERGNYLTPAEIFDGKRIHIFKRAYMGPVHHMLKYRASPKKIKAWSPATPYEADILVIPVDHVLNGRTEHSFPGKEIYWVDGYSNILPLGEEGDRILNGSKEIIAEFRSNLEPKILKGLASVKKTETTISDLQLKKLVNLSWGRNRR